MQYTEGRVGRVFSIRLEHGERMPEALEALAAEKGVQAGLAIMVGGADDGSKVVTGPEEGRTGPPVPMVRAISGVHEVAAVGTLFPDQEGKPVLHMHAAMGRDEATTTGCIRAGLVTWHVLEIILVELTGLQAARLPDAATGFELLHCGQDSSSCGSRRHSGR